MASFLNFARIASICIGFHLGTLQGYFFHLDFWPNLNFSLEYQINLVLNWLGIYANDDGNVIRKQHQPLKAVTSGKLLTLNVLGQHLSLLET